MRKLAILIREFTTSVHEEGAGLHASVERLSEQNTNLGGERGGGWVMVGYVS
jgi:hypothetical protein